MKKIFFLLLFLSLAEVTFAQTVESSTESSSGEDIYNAVEEKPQYVGGIQEFYTYIGKNYRIPNVKGLQGKVIVQFVVEKDGSLTDIKVIRDIGHGTGKEAIRVLKKSPKWIPGKLKGVPVRVIYSLPINLST